MSVTGRSFILVTLIFYTLSFLHSSWILLAKRLQHMYNQLVVFLTHADVAELADALDLGSSVPDVQVQVLSSAGSGKLVYSFPLFCLIGNSAEFPIKQKALRRDAQLAEGYFIASQYRSRASISQAKCFCITIIVVNNIFF